MILSKQTMAVLADVVNERAKQITKGYDAQHDDGHTEAELAEAGAAMAELAADRFNHELHGYPLDDKAKDSWPEMWGPMPEKPVREALITGIALMVAEVERIDRMKADGVIVFCENGHIVNAEDAAEDAEGIVLCRDCWEKMVEGEIDQVEAGLSGEELEAFQKARTVVNGLDGDTKAISQALRAGVQSLEEARAEDIAFIPQASEDVIILPITAFHSSSHLETLLENISAAISSGKPAPEGEAS